MTQRKKALGRLIKARIKEKGISLGQASALLGHKPTVLHNAFKQNTFSTSLLLDIEEILGIEVFLWDVEGMVDVNKKLPNNFLNKNS